MFIFRPNPVRLLLTFKASLNKTDRIGNTALHWAAVSGNYVAAELLMNAGANTELKNNAVWDMLENLETYLLH